MSWRDIGRRDQNMAVAMRRWNDDLPLRHRDSWWGKDDMWLDDWKDWPMEWPQPRELMGRFTKEPDNWWKDWPAHWPRWDAVMPRVSTQLDRLDRNWRNDPFWMDIYPRWAEPIFKDGIDVQSKITNDEQRFAVDIDCYQFKPEEIQVKTLDDTLLIEGRHEDVKDRDNFTKMYFVRKYQLPQDVDITKVASSIDNRGRLSVEAPRRYQPALAGRERHIPIEGIKSSPRGRTDSGFDNGYSTRSTTSPVNVVNDDRSREIRVDTSFGRDDHRSRSQNSREHHFGQELRDGREATQHLSPGSRDGYSTQSYSYHRSESRNRLSPHDVTMSNENRAYQGGSSPRRASFDTRENIASATTGGLRSHSRGADYRESASRSESRIGGANEVIIPTRSESRGREFTNGYSTTERNASRSETTRIGGANEVIIPTRSESRGREHNSGYSTTESRNGYRVDSPASTNTGILRNGGGVDTHRDTARDSPRSETSSMRSIQILRKTFG